MEVKFKIDDTVWVIKDFTATECEVESIEVKREHVMYTLYTVEEKPQCKCEYQDGVFESKEALLKKVSGS